jgi:YVTN family beta-propeller protein
VSVISGRTNKVIARIGVRGLAIAVDPQTDTIYDVTVATGQAGPVAVIDGKTNTVTATFTVRNPWGIAVNPQTDNDLRRQLLACPAPGRRRDDKHRHRDGQGRFAALQRRGGPADRARVCHQPE